MAKQLHAVLFPYLEQSHVTPMFALGRALASRGVLVTCVLPQSRSVAMAGSGSSGLFGVQAIPDGEEDTGDLDLGSRLTFQKLEPGLDELMHRLQPRPSCLVSDLLFPWTQDLADRHGVRRFQFSPYPAHSYLAALHLPVLVAKGLLPMQPGMEEEELDFIPGLIKGFQLKDVPMDFLHRSPVELDFIYQLHNSEKGAGVVINTAYELEPDALDALSAKGLSLFPVGPMFTIDWNNQLHRDSSLFTEDEECLRWLDSQPRGAVVYASFGSIISLTEQDIQELALGLEACGQPFLWVIRNADSMSGRPVLPPGFEERTKKMGRIISWAPQTAVLSHPSVGCFLSHCGYGSILEAVWAGVPMIGGFYKISDQNTNFKLVTDGWGVALPLRDQKTRPHVQRPLRECIEEAIKELMHGQPGQQVKKRSAESKEAIRRAVRAEGCSQLSLDKLIEKLGIADVRQN